MLAGRVGDARGIRPSAVGWFVGATVLLSAWIARVFPVDHPGHRPGAGLRHRERRPRRPGRPAVRCDPEHRQDGVASPGQSRLKRPGTGCVTTTEEHLMTTHDTRTAPRGSRNATRPPASVRCGRPCGTGTSTSPPGSCATTSGSGSAARREMSVVTAYADPSRSQPWCADTGGRARPSRSLRTVRRSTTWTVGGPPSSGRRPPPIRRVARRGPPASTPSTSMPAASPGAGRSRAAVSSADGGDPMLHARAQESGSVTGNSFLGMSVPSDPLAATRRRAT